MKKVIFTLAAAAFMLLASGNANAQIYFGGSIGFTTSTQRTPAAAAGTQNDQIVSGTSFKFLPEVGYRINSRMAVGGTVGFAKGYAAFGDLNPNDFMAMLTDMASYRADIQGDNTRMNGWRMAPYFRFTLVDSRKFALFVDGVVALGGVSINNKDANGNWAANPTTMTLIETGVKPGFQFNVDTHFAIIGHLGFLGFQSLKNNQNDQSMSHLGLDLHTNNISLGFIYSL